MLILSGVFDTDPLRPCLALPVRLGDGCRSSHPACVCLGTGETYTHGLRHAPSSCIVLGLVLYASSLTPFPLHAVGWVVGDAVELLFVLEQRSVGY